MRLPHQNSRINLNNLKAQLVKKLGHEGSKQYFYYLHWFLSLKLSMPEFNKLCLRILGRENIKLHNHFIRSILRNACSAKAPPPTTNHHKDNNDFSKRVHSKGRARNDEKMDASTGQRKSCPAVSGVHKLVSPFRDGVLVGSCVLRKWMENIASEKGMEGVSDECANVLNHGLDSYLKGLIMSCVDVVRVRSGLELTNESSPSPSKDQARMKISLQEFRVAMELNPRQLGEDWPLLLEKICTHAFEE